MMLSHDTASASSDSPAISRSVLAPAPADEARLTVLVGPSSLSAIESIDWGSAQPRYLRKFRDASQPAANHVHYDAESIRAYNVGKPVPPELAALILRLSADANCFLLAERDRGSLLDGALLAPVEIASCARFAWGILQEHAPDLVIFHNCPHELFTYVLLRAALALNIPTLLVHFSALPWRMSISRYAPDGTARKLPLKESSSAQERDSVDRYVRRLQQTHEQAIPFSNQGWISPRNPPLSLRSEWQGLMRGGVLKSLLRMGVKTSLYLSFLRSVNDCAGGPYVVFLMHYQPEESTIPRGGVFSQQVNAIVKLRSLLPPEVKILVKENRATFRAPLALAIGVRSRRLYEAITALPQTYLVALERNTFDLIDGALAVATITGTAGLEALCRGKKVIIFGDANYKAFRGVIRLDTPEWEQGDLAAAISDPHDSAATRSDLLMELLRSIGPEQQDYETIDQAQQGAVIQAFEHVARHTSELLDGQR
jgi:hypothetical protein